MDLWSVDPVLLRTFRAVVAHRSMARAAEELGFVPSAVSQHVSRLERLLGTRLLIRAAGAPLAPTPAGRQIDRAAATLLGATADFVSACRAAAGGQVELRVAVYASAACELLPATIVGLRAEQPDARVRVIQAEPDTAVQALVTGAVDLVIAYRYLPGEAVASAETHETVLGTERLPLVWSPTAAHADLDWAGGIPGSPSRRLLEQWASVSGTPVDVQYESEDPHTVLALCAAGLGQGLVPASVLAARQDLRVTIRDLTIAGRPLTRQVLAMTRKGYVHPLSDRVAGGLRLALASLTSGLPDGRVAGSAPEDPHADAEADR